ncbi:MAG: hypothetical protein V3R99_01495 [Thermoguttaceae bacterium]
MTGSGIGSDTGTVAGGWGSIGMIGSAERTGWGDTTGAAGADGADGAASADTTVDRAGAYATGLLGAPYTTVVLRPPCDFSLNTRSQNAWLRALS